MSGFWRTASRRIDALSLRERVILFVSVSASLVALADVMVLSPQLAQHKALLQRTRDHNETLAQLRSRLGADGSASVADPTPRGRAQRALDAVRARQQVLDLELDAQRRAGAGTARLATLLERLLRRHERLTLLQLTTPTPSSVAVTGEAPLLPVGVDLRIRGSYADLSRYLHDLEIGVPGLRWGPLFLDARGDTPVLELRVFMPGGAG